MLGSITCKFDEMALNDIDPKSQLVSDTQRSFFQIGYIEMKNPLIADRIRPRNSEHYADSLFAYLLDLELSDPYIENLVSLIGFPVWTFAIVHAKVDSILETVTLPFTGTADSTTLGHLTCVYDGAVWSCTVLRRDTLYAVPGSQELILDPNVPSYVFMITFYDEILFGYYDSTLHLLKKVIKDGFADGQEVIKPRCETSITQTCEWCTGAFTGKEIIVRGWWCNCQVYMESVNCQETGYGHTLWDAGGSDGGGGTGGGTGDGGSGWSPPVVCPCGCTPYLAPYLCLTDPDLTTYGGVYIAAYNQLVVYLYATHAEWILNNVGLTEINSYLDFINN